MKKEPDTGPSIFSATSVLYNVLYYTGNDTIRGAAFWIIMSILAGSSIVIALSIYKNISYKNINRKWVRSLLNGSGGKSVIKAIEYIPEIEEFKKGIPGLFQVTYI